MYFDSDDDIECDGRRFLQKKDPPGQKCVYVAPGDRSKEFYRLSTYIRFPETVQINPIFAARAGFFYTGYKDRITCYCCGISVENWQPEDDPLNAKWHNPGCDVLKECDCLFYEQNEERSESATSQAIAITGPKGIWNNNPAGGARELNRQQSSSLPEETQGTSAPRMQLMYGPRRPIPVPHPEPGPDPNDPFEAVSFQAQAQPPVVHRQTASVHEPVRRDRPPPPAVNHPRPRINNNQNNDRELASRMETFPCLYPVNGHMFRFDDRMKTFDNPGWRPYMTSLDATPADISQAGFYYLGQRDRVKCWYCNGGLQNWERQDEPWFEHAKWFPACEFLLQQKGPLFVNRVVSMFPDLQRPRLYTNEEIRNRMQRERRGEPIGPAPVIVDPAVEIARIEGEVDAMIANNDSKVVEARNMGFGDAQIKVGLIDYYHLKNSHCPDLLNLIERLVDIPDEEPQEQPIESNNEEGDMTATIGPEAPQSTEGPQEAPEQEVPSAPQRREREETDMTCKICLDKQSNVVFVPCGHLCTCMDCSPSLHKCPVCRVIIVKKIRSYFP